MSRLTYEGIRNAADWGDIRLPAYDVSAMREQTLKAPLWLHFGAGNIFRGFIAALQHSLLQQGLCDRGIIAAETFDAEIIARIYAPHDNLALLTTLHADGTMQNSVVAAIAHACDTASLDDLRAFAAAPSLQLMSFTITEKGYALYDLSGKPTPLALSDMQNGPAHPVHAMAVVAALLLARYEAGGAPLALVSMDNCSHNGERLRGAVLDIAKAWRANGFVSDEFIAYISDEARVAFPWTMIDKITPRPAEEVRAALERAGVQDMMPMTTAKSTVIAPFVNAEAPEYLVVEDAFPNGRPPLERAGVLFCPRETVNQVERMKVTTCLNPLHTALAVFGCLLGYTSIAEETRDAQLTALIRRIGYDEGLPVVTHPGILDPRKFLDEVFTQRLPNRFIPDTPQRIATDTSQKMGIRFGETIKAYVADPERSVDSLVGIPLAIAGWLRYLLAVDDDLAPMTLSPDPLLTELSAALSGIVPGQPDTARGKLTPVLSNASLFGIDLYQAGLGGRIEACFAQMLAGRGAVRATLMSNL